MGISRFRTMIGQAMMATGLLLGSTLASAATVSVVPVTQDVFPSDTVTVDIMATDLIDASGGAMDVTWNPTVLRMNPVVPLTDAEVDIFDSTNDGGPWDDPDGGGFSDRGVLSAPGFLEGFQVGLFPFPTGFSGNTLLGTLTFTAIGAVGSSTSITVAQNTSITGGTWSPPIDTYIPGEVAVVPIPAAVWLFGSGLLGLVGVARRRRT
jgi:hypothetical protein